MSRPKISLSMRAGAGINETHEVSTNAGSEVSIEYDPAKAVVGVDYSRDDGLVLSANGELSMKIIGMPSVTLGSGAKVSADGTSFDGNVAWEIDKAVAAKATIARSPSGTTGMMTVTIKFL